MAMAQLKPSPATGEKGGAEPEFAPLIPGLPDEVAELCILQIPFPQRCIASSVSATWCRALLSSRNPRGRALRPHLFALAFDRATMCLNLLVLDTVSGIWQVLPAPRRCKSGADYLRLCPSAFAVASSVSRAEIYVLGGMVAETGEHVTLNDLLIYRAATNSWVSASPMPTSRAFFAAAELAGKVYAFGGDGAVDMYDPEADRWDQAPAMPHVIGKYDSAAAGHRVYLTEGWTWPFNAPPRGAAYDADTGTWSEMPRGMKEGWTGSSAVADGELYMVAEYGDGKLKKYEEKNDRWVPVAGGGVPAEVRRPHSVVGGTGRKIYVVGRGARVAIGTVAKKSGHGDGDEGEERVDWEVVSGPHMSATADLAPCAAHLLYV